MTTIVPWHVHALALPSALGLLPLGFATGCAYFVLLRRGVARLISGGSGAWGLGLLLMRIGPTVLLLAAAAQWGPVALLATFGGFLLARPLALRLSARVSLSSEAT